MKKKFLKEKEKVFFIDRRGEKKRDVYIYRKKRKNVRLMSPYIPIYIYIFWGGGKI